ncbi:MAG TPA: PA2169 family four-helix-bundle protein [Planctomycetota bacterium]|nr:PA2169 family four-helix-bundle protein [Planctomycetota bacterium]
MSFTNDDAIKCLNDLIETCRDGQRGFESAAEAVKEPRYKDLFRRNSLQRARFVTELQGEVSRLGGKAESEGTTAGALHRGWINLKTALSSRDEKAVLAECERGEDHAVKVYGEAVEQPLPEPARAIVRRQYSEVRLAHDTMRDLRNLEKHAD